MYIVFGTFIILIIYLFGSTIVKIFKSYATQSNIGSQIGNLWFSGLLIINITLIIFIYAFYYYKSNAIGKDGPSGDKGFTGKDGEGCLITIPNNNNYVNYSKIWKYENMKIWK